MKILVNFMRNFWTIFLKFYAIRYLYILRIFEKFTKSTSVTNSRKHEDDYQCVAQLTTQDLQYIKLYPLQICLLMSSPPSPPLLLENSVS